MNDMESDTHLRTKLITTTTFTIPPEFIAAVTKEVQKNLDLEYINDSISEWMRSNFDLTDYRHDYIKDEITYDILKSLSSRIHAKVEIHLD